MFKQFSLPQIWVPFQHARFLITNLAQMVAEAQRCCRALMTFLVFFAISGYNTYFNGKFRRN